MRIIKLKAILKSKKLQNDIVSLIKRGGLFIYPTDTVYGLGCSALNLKTTRRIRKIKRTKHPFSVIAPSKEWIEKNFKVKFPKQMKKLPGKVTLILKMKDRIVPILITKTNNLGIRIPAHPLTKIIQMSGLPFVTTSANISRQKPIESISYIPDKMAHKADIIIDGGILKGKPSRVINLVGSRPKIIRK